MESKNEGREEEISDYTEDCSPTYEVEDAS